MKTIQVYDPPMCCSTGLCGNDIDPALVNFAALLTQLSQKGVKVERYNLGQQPMAFVQNPVVKALLDKESVAALPLILLDGELHLKGRYLTDEERVTFSRAALSEGAGVSS
jgi:Arsenical resistance operon protein ArsD